jgi:hypothetical protein
MVATAIDQGIREQRFGIAEVAPAAQYVAAFGPPWASRLSPASSEGIDIWNVGSFWGRSDHAAPADWTDIVTCIVENRGGAVRHRAYFPQERSYRVHVVWPERPPIDTLESVRSELAEALAWQR